MDDTLTSWFSSIRVGCFDFEGESDLQKSIAWFDLFVKNINSSYLLLEFHLYLTDAYVAEQTQIINSDYYDTLGYIIPSLVRSRNTNGAKRSLMNGFLRWGNARRVMP